MLIGNYRCKLVMLTKHIYEYTTGSEVDYLSLKHSFFFDVVL